MTVKRLRKECTHKKGKCGVNKTSVRKGRGWIFEASKECGEEGGAGYRQSNTKCIVEVQLGDVI